jgi:hypothetical protein
VKINHQFTPKDGLFCKHRATPELICGYPRASHPAPEPLVEPMHFWPPSGPGFVCDADQGFKSSDVGSVTCPKCVTWLQREQRIVDVMRETGESRATVTDMLEAIECCASEGVSEALGERRQAAREAFHDAAPSDRTARDAAEAAEAAIETATRVQVTPEIVAAGSDADSAHSYGADYGAIIIAAFRAAGFEVVE